MHVFKRLISIMLQFWDRLVLGIFSSLMVSSADAISVGAIKFIIDILDVGSHQSRAGQPFQHHLNISFREWNFFSTNLSGLSEYWKAVLLIALIAFLSIFILKGIFLYFKLYCNRSFIFKTLMDLRKRIYSRVVCFPVSFYDQNRTGDLMSRITNDVDSMRFSLISTTNVIFDLVHAVFFVTLMFLFNWRLTLFAVIVFPIVAYIVRKFSKPLRKANTKILENTSRIMQFLQETLQGIRIIKVFNREDTEIRRFRGLAKDNYATNMKETRLSAFQKPINDMLNSFSVIALMLVMGWQVLYQGWSFSSMVAYIVLMNMAYKPLKTISSVNDAVQRTVASGKRIFDLIDLPTEADGKEGRLPDLEVIKGEIEYRSVGFSYKKEAPVLDDISFKVRTGESLALVGASGSGKSTIASLLPRFYDPDQGEILIDRQSARRFSLKSLRESMAFVPQETVLFSGTVRENIMLGNPEATEKEMVQAAQDAQAHEFISKLNNGYDTQIGERGVQLSGGEKQRLAISRALLRNPRILILDEATSALDTESEKLVQKALNCLMKNRTTLVIAHRLSTIKNANQILVLKDGKIAERGTHDELHAQNGDYRKLWEMQT